MSRKRSRPTMNHDELLQTFRSILEKKIDLPQDATNELILAAIVDTRMGVSDVMDKMNTVCDEVKIIRENDIPHILSDIEAIDTRFKKNPSLLWLLRYQTSKTVKYLIGVITFIIIALYLIATVPAARELIAKLLGID